MLRLFGYVIIMVIIAAIVFPATVWALVGLLNALFGPKGKGK